MLRRYLFPAVAAVTCLVACSEDATSSSSSGAPAATGCAADTRKDIYTAGITKPAGSLAVKVVDAMPGPPQKGTNALTIEIVDAGGQPVDGAVVTVTPFMPDHGHGSAVTPVVAASGGGKYAVSKVYLAMAGLWKLTVSVQMASGELQETAFQFCVDG